MILYIVIFRLGEFDPDSMNPYSTINLDQVLSPEHRALAVDVSVKTFVLLKNEENTLPITKQPGTMAVSFVPPVCLEMSKTNSQNA